MNTLIAPLSRSILRYLVGSLVTAGFLLPEDGAALVNDPDILILIGLGIGAIVEGLYAAARKLGWAT
jgi:hypothetical protein